jgi:hypothetical protein
MPRRSRKKTNSGLKSGFLQAIISLIAGLLLTYVLGYLVNNQIIPSYSLTIFSIINILSNIISIISMRSWGLFYTIGWLGGSLIFIEMGFLETPDFILNIIVPIAILVLRLILWAQKRAKRLSF